MPEIDSVALHGRRRKWLIAASIGCAMVALAMITATLVISDKAHFGWLVGSMFLPVITSGAIVGAIVLLIATWNLPERKRWQGLTLMLWGLLALTSPAFGIMFLLPWGVLALSLPLVIAALVILFRQGLPRPAQLT
jgi:MFS family permease